MFLEDISALTGEASSLLREMNDFFFLQEQFIHLSLLKYADSDSDYPSPGCRGNSLRQDAYISLHPATTSSSSKGTSAR